MESLYFSFIIPVYNRPDEINELLESFVHLNGAHNYEIVIVEDGSSLSSKAIVDRYKQLLTINYYYKANSGPGDSRNFGMEQAKGNYFIILDSDVILPKHYLEAVRHFLSSNFCDVFGGPDAAHSSFSQLQKAINFSMTSFITTGGIRGGKKQVNAFQPRSFNMGLSKYAFEQSGGFGKIHPGEDPDLSLRLKKSGFTACLINEAFVFHKRRISWSKFYTQVNKFGLVRPILNTWHPASKSIVFWFPTFFILGFLLALSLLVIGVKLPFILYVCYFLIAFIMAFITNKSITVAVLAIVAIAIQFFGYGFGFLKSTYKVVLLKQNPKEAFPHLFF